MELRHIRYFKAVAEEKNFTKAAEKLAIAQPPLSRQIQDLEAELGTPLFIRSPHKVTLTEEGELFLQYASQILDLVNRSEEPFILLPWKAVDQGSLQNGSPPSRRSTHMYSIISGMGIRMM